MAKQPRSLVGQVIAITGGARGIGRTTATTLVREGAKVAIGDIDHAAAEQAAAEIGGGTIGLPVDVTSKESFEAFIDATEAKLGPLDVLVNNAVRSRSTSGAFSLDRRSQGVASVAVAAATL